MNYKRCIYFVEGNCEQQLINALKMEPRKLIPGKVTVHNVIQNIIPRREVNKILPGTIVVFVFDTDVEKTDILIKNVDYLKKYVSKVKIINLAQVKNFEDEMVRATNVKKAQDLTKSRSASEFKSDFCRLKVTECRKMLERHEIKVGVLWTTNVPDSFHCVVQNSECVKI